MKEFLSRYYWIPACAGMTGGGDIISAGMTGGRLDPCFRRDDGRRGYYFRWGDGRGTGFQLELVPAKLVPAEAGSRNPACPRACGDPFPSAHYSHASGNPINPIIPAKLVLVKTGSGCRNDAFSYFISRILTSISVSSLSRSTSIDVSVFP